MIERAKDLISIPGHVLALAEAALAQSGLAPSGPPTVQRHWGISTVLTFPTRHGRVWFKQVPPIFSHEGAVTSCLAGIVPSSLPRLLAWDKGWMLMEEFPLSNRAMSEHPLATLARIQLASVDHLASLAAARCPSQSPGTLMANLAWLEQHPDRQVRGRLDRSLPYVSDACARMADLRIPTTVVHGDFSIGNAHQGPSGWIIYDWTDAFLGNPFIDVVYSLMREEPGVEEAFRRVWLEVLPAETVAQAWELAPVIGAAHYAVMLRRIMDSVADPTPFHASLDMWLRLLTTHPSPSPYSRGKACLR